MCFVREGGVGAVRTPFFVHGGHGGPRRGAENSFFLSAEDTEGRGEGRGEQLYFVREGPRGVGENTFFVRGGHGGPRRGAENSFILSAKGHEQNLLFDVDHGLRLR